MKVKLKQKWFIRDIPYDSYGRVFVGRLYRKGEHEMPDDMYDAKYVVKSANGKVTEHWLMPRKQDGFIVDWIMFTDDGGRSWRTDSQKAVEAIEVEPEEKQPDTLSGMSKKAFEEDPVRQKIEEADTNFRKKK